ncbi:CinA family protein [Cobetia sp. 14N.309.X.WAT.E.A4]|uniref:CinA family protein n=1 Tax=Cobetia sp. 14N.309.X.WAT.E.A4 TaxID=2998323 RepID=UPI0025B1C3E4|nr:CinA family protein [Cobetia sp. 14N.309.X.WAT.E.A4]MDN2657240.1 CinA family protein [Cobetia sp. 14N.309.X.WAT.E.A4]
MARLTDTTSEAPDANALAEQLQALALARGVQITAAESCTGGGVSAAITAISGSSGYFEAGYVTYSNAAKRRLLGVSEASLADFGAVSEAVVREMVRGACRDSGAELGGAISGVAGPGGGSEEKPVGTVWLAWGSEARQQARCFHFPGDRQAVRDAAVRVALQGLIECVEAWQG